MEPNTNETQLNSEQNIPPSIETPQSPKNNLKWFIIVVIILILGGGIFAYTKYMPDVNNQKNTVNMDEQERLIESNKEADQEFSGEPTAEEKEKVRLSFIKIKDLYSKKDINGIKQYLIDQGNTQKEVDKVFSEKEDDWLKEIETTNTFFLPNLTVDQILDAEDTLWHKGALKNNGSYIEVDYFTQNPLTNVNGMIVYTFTQEGDGWYWAQTNFKYLTED